MYFAKFTQQLSSCFSSGYRVHGPFWSWGPAPILNVCYLVNSARVWIFLGKWFLSLFHEIPRNFDIIWSTVSPEFNLVTVSNIWTWKFLQKTLFFNYFEFLLAISSSLANRQQKLKAESRSINQATGIESGGHRETAAGKASTEPVTNTAVLSWQF